MASGQTLQWVRACSMTNLVSGLVSLKSCRKSSGARWQLVGVSKQGKGMRSSVWGRSTLGMPARLIRFTPGSA